MYQLVGLLRHYIFFQKDFYRRGNGLKDTLRAAAVGAGAYLETAKQTPLPPDKNYNHGKDEDTKTPETKTQLTIQGEVNADTVENSAQLSLENGLSRIRRFLTHDKSITEIDLLTLLGAHHNLYGNILINKYVHGDREGEQNFTIYGIINILKGQLSRLFPACG